MSNGHRWSKFWWADWHRDDALRGCSFAAQGLWMRLLCIAHEADPCGYVLINGQRPTMRKLAAMGNSTEKEVAKLLAELEAEGVFSRTEDGTIYSRRMVRDAAASAAGREHIAKRWNGHDPPITPNSPPNRVPNRSPNSPPNREPTREASRDPKSPPMFSPQTPLSSDSEAEAEERKQESLKTLTFFSVPPRGKRHEMPLDSLPPAELKRLMDEMEAREKPRVDRKNDPENVSADPGISAIVRRTAKACELRIPYGEVRSAEAQAAALEAQPQAVGADVTLGLAWRPHEPIRSPLQMMAEVDGVSLAEAARRYPALASSIAAG